MKFLVIGLTTALIVILSFLIGNSSPMWGLVFFTFFESLFLVQALRKIELVHAGIETLAGKRQKNSDGTTRHTREGWHLFPFQPFLFGAIQIKVESINFDPTFDGIRTPDMAELKFHTGVTVDPWPDYLINYENRGEEAGVKKILEDVIGGSIRSMAISPTEDPKNWKDAIRMQKAFLGRVVEKMMSRYDTPFDPDDQNALDELVEQLEDGGGNFPIKDLGVIVRRINVKKVEPQGKLHEDAEKFAREEAQKDAEVRERNFMVESVVMIEKETGLNPQESMKAFQTERGKIKQEVKETRISMSPEVAELMSPFVALLNKLLERRT